MGTPKHNRSTPTHRRGEVQYRQSSTASRRKAPPRKQKKKNGFFYNLVFFVALIVLVISVGYLGKTLVYDPWLVGQKADAAKGQVNDEHGDKVNENGVLLKYEDLLAQYPNLKGWVTIDGTNIDYPIYQSGLDDPEYHLYRDADGNDLKAGSLFFDAKCDILNGQVWSVYGHHMKDGTMFADIVKKYEPTSAADPIAFYRAHPTVALDSIYETGEWKIFSYFKVDNAPVSGEPFYFNQLTFGSNEAFMAFIAELQSRSLINTTVDVQSGDDIAFLVTCSYEFSNADLRTVIAVRRVRDGESSSVDVENASRNTDALMPDRWYQ